MESRTGQTSRRRRPGAPFRLAVLLVTGAFAAGDAAAQTFDDVPPGYWAFDFIETLAATGVSGGCGAGNFCPEALVTRAQMAVFLERAMNGSDYVPPAATGAVFADVGAADFAAGFIEQLFADGITGGCGGGNYCPGDPVTRAQMAVFLLRAMYGAGYQPPPVYTPVFGDVGSGDFGAAWIHALLAEGITSGCGNGNFCPSAPIRRAQMAVFLVRAFDLEAPPPPGTIGDGQLPTIVADTRARNGTPALTAVVVRNGLIAESAASGLRTLSDTAEVTTSDRWHIGSLTKAITATLVGALVEQSLLTWETRPLDVLPEFAATTHAAFADVTITELLAHRAGVSNDVFGVTDYWSIVDDAPGTIGEKRRLWTRDLLAADPVVPRGDYYYSNGGYIVVGAMLEAVTGDTWENLVQAQVFGPLGMSQSGFGAPGTPGQADQPWGHAGSGGDQPVPPGPGSDNPAALGPAGTVHTTLADYARYMTEHIDGALGRGSLLTTATYQQLHTPLPGNGYALGWIVGYNPPPTGRMFAHDGSNTLWYARVRLYPDLEAGHFIVTNASDDGARQAVNELDAELLERLFATP